MPSEMDEAVLASNAKMAQIVQVSPENIRPVRDGIVRVYAAAFGEPPYNEGEAEAEHAMQSLVSHSRRGGFRLFVAKDEAGQVIGFSYGYQGRPGQWWHDFVSRLLSAEARAQWLGNCFQFVELAVLPSFQGQGIGGRLHDALLAGVPYHTAVLSTYSGQNRAMGLYQKRGWKRLVDDLAFPGSTIPMVVLGLALEK